MPQSPKEFPAVGNSRASPMIPEDSQLFPSSAAGGGGQQSSSSSASVVRPRAQSCSVTPGRTSGTSPKSRRSRRTTSTRRSERRSTGRPSSSSKGTASPQQQLSVPASPLTGQAAGRRLSPATMEAARLALAARAEYSKRRSSRCLEKATFYIVTKDDEQKLDDLEMAVLLNNSSRRGSSAMRPGTPGSHRSVGTDSVGGGGGGPTGGGGVWREPKRSPSATASISSGSHNNSPKRTHGQGHGAHGGGQGHHAQKLRLSSFSSDVATPTSGVPASPMLRIFQGGGRKTSRVSADNDSCPDSSHDPYEQPRPSEAGGGSAAMIADAEGGVKGTSGKTSVVKLAVAGVFMLSGTCAFIAAYVLARGETWTIVGSSVMGIGSLLVLIGICWYLASTQDRVGDGGDPVEIKMVDQSQLARLIKKGACVETVTVRV